MTDRWPKFGPQVVSLAVDGERRGRELLSDARALGPRLETAARVFVQTSDHDDLLVALLACWERDLPGLLLPRPEPALIQRERDRGLSVVVLDGSRGEDLGESRAPCSERAIAAPQVLVELLTSGSTGEPGRHAKTAGQLFGEAGMLAEFLSLSERGPVVSTVPGVHIYGLLVSLLCPVIAGVPFCRAQRLHAADVFEQIECHQVGTLVSTPAHLRALAGRGRFPGLVVSSGAPLDRELAGVLARETEVVELFGSTETGGIAARRFPDVAWQPLPSVELGTRSGQLWVKSPWTPDQAELLTADRAELEEGGAFRHLGRADSVVKVAGKRVDLEEISRLARGLEGVVDAVALALDDASRGAEIVLFVAAEGLDPRRLRGQLLEVLDPTLVPRRIRVLPSLPRGAGGKPSRDGLLALLRGDDVGDPEFARLSLKSSSDERAVFEVSVTAASRGFRGHFPDEAIFPAVALLDHVLMPACERAWPDMGPVTRVVRLKFSAPIEPDLAGLVLQLERRGSKLRFTLADAQTRYSSGELVCAGAT